MVRPAAVGLHVAVCILVTLVMYQLTMFLILVCKIPDMLATCALMFVHQGLGQWYIGGGAVSTGMRLPSGASPVRTKLEPSFSAIGREPWLIVIMLACVLVAYIFLEYTKHRRFIYAMGGNKQAAKLSGINVKALPLPGRHDHRRVHRHRRHPGLLPRLFRAGHVLRRLPDAVAWLPCSSAAPSAVRRKPNALGTLIGAMLVSTLENGLTICAVPYYVLPAVKGAVLALASGRGLRHQEGAVIGHKPHRNARRSSPGRQAVKITHLGRFGGPAGPPK